MKIAILGLTVTSSWGNGHATTYRSLIRGLANNGHDVMFLERDAPWYAGNRDQPNPAGSKTFLYNSTDELVHDYEDYVAKADLVIVGSFVPDGIAVGEWVTTISKGLTAFYDIDTPITIESLEKKRCDYLTEQLVRRYSMYLSFTGGPMLANIERQFASPMARVLYCSVDTDKYVHVECSRRWDLGYLGTWSEDRQPYLDAFLIEPARAWREGRFAVVGPQYPEDIVWPDNVFRDIHLAPGLHPRFYGSQRFTLNITREAMKAAGYSPSVRLFEAGACGVPIISDWWEGLDSIFEPGREILLSNDFEDSLRILRDLPESAAQAIAAAARKRVLAEHTPFKRVSQLEAYVSQAKAMRSANVCRSTEVPA